MAAHSVYMASEYPARGNRFWAVATALREYVGQTPMSETDLFRYLGRPDWFYVTNVVMDKAGQAAETNRMVFYAYLFDRPGKEGKWSAMMPIADDAKVHDIGFPDADRIERLGFRPLPVYSAPNQQKGANGSHPASADTNGTSSGGSRRSP